MDYKRLVAKLQEKYVFPTTHISRRHKCSHRLTCTDDMSSWFKLFLTGQSLYRPFFRGKELAAGGKKTNRIMKICADDMSSGT